jgi:hypothetical protein
MQAQWNITPCTARPAQRRGPASSLRCSAADDVKVPKRLGECSTLVEKRADITDLQNLEKNLDKEFLNYWQNTIDLEASFKSSVMASKSFSKDEAIFIFTHRVCCPSFNFAVHVCHLFHETTTALPIKEFHIPLHYRARVNLLSLQPTFFW